MSFSFRKSSYVASWMGRINFQKAKTLSQKSYILGLETSCDDTAAAILDHTGNIISDKVQSQTKFSVLFGGVLPSVARELHQKSIARVTESTMAEADISWKDLDCIAVTVKPGMPLSLKVGVSFAKMLAKQHALPIMPVHHMEAHALTAMLTNTELRFPFLVLLLSGGHGLLALARGVEEFLLLGIALDASPGDVLDKVARRLKLSRIGDSRLTSVSGGRAVEILAAESTDAPPKFVLPSPRSQKRDCDFSFTGIHIAAERLIDKLEMDHAVNDDSRSSSILPRNCLADICGSVQFAMTRLICRRVQRAIELATAHSSLLASNLLLPTALVVSGGVAANAYIRSGLTETAAHYGLPLIAPPPRLCTDNGVMIAWNGLLLRRAGSSRIVHDPSLVDFESRAPFGIDCRSLVRNANLKIKPIKLEHASLKSSFSN